MSRLPKPGSNQGKWGEILNDYLSQSHKADGTLKDGSVGTTQLQDNSITTTKLQDNSVTNTKLANNTIEETKLSDSENGSDPKNTKTVYNTPISTENGK